MENSLLALKPELRERAEAYMNREVEVAVVDPFGDVYGDVATFG